MLAAMVMCLCALGPLLTRGHLALMLGWTGCMVVALIYVLIQFKDLKSNPDA